VPRRNRPSQKPCEPTLHASDREHLEDARTILGRYRVGLFIVSLGNASSIDGAVECIPSELRDLFAEIYTIDDSSGGGTALLAADTVRPPTSNLLVLRTSFKCEYGARHKLGLSHAIHQHLDFLIVMPRDGQSLLKCLADIIVAFKERDVDLVVTSPSAIETKTSKRQWFAYAKLATRMLTTVRNALHLGQWSLLYSCCRAYRVKFLESIPFSSNSNDDQFASELLVQCVATQARVSYVSVPSADSGGTSLISRLVYAHSYLGTLIKYRLTQLGVFYHASFDFHLFERTSYYLKRSSNSLHQFVLNRRWDPAWRVADLGANEGQISQLIAEKVSHVTAVDVSAPNNAGHAQAVSLDLNAEFDQILGMRAFDCVLALDVVEHLGNPESAVRKIFNILEPGGLLYASTGNIAFWPLRLSLLFGQFNYGKRGVLDLTHSRLFTIRSFKSLLTLHGFQIEDTQYFGPPIVDMVGNHWLLRALDLVSGRLAGYWPGLLAYSFLVIARRVESLEDIYQRADLSKARS
jgi:2-polyprenyl-3-methyl-5-hydroxy-6-metoxy-1,4-benzoquinol methylase